MRFVCPGFALGAMAAATLVLGCGDAGTGSGGGGGGSTSYYPAEEQRAACMAIAEKDCEAWARCVPDTFASFFADPSECVEKSAAYWAGHFFGSDSGATLETTEQCGAELDLSKCDAWWYFNFAAGPGACERTSAAGCEGHRLTTFGAGPASCFPKGSRARGEPCGSGAQCDSGICWFGQDPGIACGRCERGVSDQGAPCPEGVSCAGPLKCEMQVCQPLSGLYGSCGACLPHLVCFAGQCRERLDDGAPCDPIANAGVDDCQADHVCNAVTSQCEARAMQPLGEACGALAEGRVGSCEPGAACQLGTTVNEATCTARIPLGEPCGTGYIATGGCDFPGDCVEGVCQLRGASTCE